MLCWMWCAHAMYARLNLLCWNQRSFSSTFDAEIKHMEGGAFGVSSEKTTLSVDFENTAANLPGGYTDAESLPQFPWIDSSEHIICVARRWLQEEVQFLASLTKRNWDSEIPILRFRSYSISWNFDFHHSASPDLFYCRLAHTHAQWHEPWRTLIDFFMIVAEVQKFFAVWRRQHGKIERKEKKSCKDFVLKSISSITSRFLVFGPFPKWRKIRADFRFAHRCWRLTLLSMVQWCNSEVVCHCLNGRKNYIQIVVKMVVVDPFADWSIWCQSYTLA